MEKHVYCINMLTTFPQGSPMFIVFPKVPFHVPKYKSYMNMGMYVVPPLMHINYLCNMTNRA